MNRRFNLVYEKWIPVTGNDLLSLQDVFANPSLVSIGGTPIQKIALTKFLLAIAHSAFTPNNHDEWESLKPEGLACRSREYLQKNQDEFWLYEPEHPFLQMPVISKAEKQSPGALSPIISSGNTTVLTQSQIERPLSDSERALLLVTLMGFALGGKKTDNSVTLSPHYMGKKNEKQKPSTGKPGPFVGYMGYLHGFVNGSTLHETLFLNLLTLKEIESFGVFTAGTGRPPWEDMPQGEACKRASELKNSYIGRLIPLSRFVLWADDGQIHYSEGISFPPYDKGGIDPSISIDQSGKKSKALWTSPGKRPWRELASMLSFLDSSRNNGFLCHFIKIGVGRAKEIKLPGFSIWVGGLRVSSNAGEQYASGTDDFVESEINLDTASLGSVWLATLEVELANLDALSKTIYACTMAYYKALKDNNAEHASRACSIFWQLAEKNHQELICACSKDDENRAALRSIFIGYANRVYDLVCPSDTARQLEAWAGNRPNFSKRKATKQK